MSSSTTFDGGRFEPHAAEDGRQQPPSAPLFRLRPNHGVVFLEFDVPCQLLGQTQVWLLEESIEDEYGRRPVLVPLDRESICDGTAWHPVTHLPLGPNETLWLNGFDGIAPYLGSWIPVPYLRNVSDRGGQNRLDNGPLNWVRLFLVPPEGGLRSSQSLKAVLAIDTRLSEASRVDDAAYLAPSAEDANFGSTFTMAGSADELAMFLGETWVDTWLADAYRSESSNRDAEPGSVDGHQLAHIACFIALMTTLSRVAPTPQLRFYSSVNRNLTKDRDGLELIVDVSGSEINAFLVGRQALDPGDTPSIARPLGIRELSAPDRITRGIIPAHVEFDQPTIGNARLSRQSGRSDACQWPSSVRIGTEARRLALRTNATAGVTGSADFMRFATDLSPSARLWRFSDNSDERTGHMATSQALDYLSEDGRIAEGEDRAPAVRPRFSKSALVTLFFGELVLHAVAQMARPQHHGVSQDSAPLSDLASIKLALPASISADEQRAILSRARDGIDLVWRLQGWDKDASGTAPSKPRLHATVGADLATQLLYLENEVESRFNGDFLALARITGRGTSNDPGVQSSLRLASLEIDVATTTLVVAEYEVTQLGTIHPVLSRAHRTPPGSSALQRAVLERCLLPAIERDLVRHQLPSAASFVREITGRAPVVWQMDDSEFAARFEQKVLEPAALGLIGLYGQAMPEVARGVEHVSFASLVEYGGGRMSPCADMFDQAATRAGAVGFSLARATLALNLRDMRDLLQNELRHLLEPLASDIDADNCDLVLISGRLPTQADVEDAFLSLVPMSPHRIVVKLSALSNLGHKALNLRDQNRLLGALGLLAEQGLLAPSDFIFKGERLLDTSRAGGDARSGPRALPSQGTQSAAARTDGHGTSTVAAMFEAGSKVAEES